MISSLPGKALRMLIESRGLPSDSTCTLKAEPYKLDIKRWEPGTLYSIYQFTNRFTLQTGDYGVIIDIHVDSMAFMILFKKCKVILT